MEGLGQQAVSTNMKKLTNFHEHLSEWLMGAEKRRLLIAAYKRIPGRLTRRASSWRPRVEPSLVERR